MRHVTVIGPLMVVTPMCGHGGSYAQETSSWTSSGSRFFNRLFSSASPAAPATPKPPQPDLYDKLLFYPTKFPKGLWDAAVPEREDAWFTAPDGTKLHGWYCPCDKPRGVVLYAHGNGGNVSYDADLLRRLQTELRVSTLAFDYRGYGRSEGRPTIEGVLDDARAARAWLAEREKIPESDIVLMGRSLGGAVVIQLASEVRPRGLVLESTFASLKAIAGHHFPTLAWAVPTSKLNSTVAIASYDGPLLQSHSAADRTIPFEQGTRVHEAARGPKEFFRLDDRDHNAPQPAEYYQRLDRFMGGLPK